MDFFRALNTDNSDRVQALLLRGFDPNTRGETGQTPLYLAIRDESPRVTAVLLVARGLQPDLANAAGETPLMMAALRGQLDWVRQLVALGAQVTRDGWTPLHYAASGPSSAVVAYLLDHGADVDARAPDGATPLMMAVRHAPEDTVRLLLARGADRRLQDKRDRSALDLAAGAGRDYLIPLLQ